MDAEASLERGDLDAALKALQGQIRKAPAEAKLRVFLFQLLCVLGHWDKALRQLQVAADLDAGALAMAATYRNAVQAEALRESVFAGERDPVVFGEPQRWIALLVEALRVSAHGDAARAQALRAEAFEDAPATAGRIDGADCAWIADADMRLGPVLEGVVDGRYCWMPFQYIQRIHLDAPTDLRDLVWAPAQVTWINGGESVVLIPVRYAGTTAQADAGLKLARRTEWIDLGADCFAGLGQRMLTTDKDEYPLLAIREIVLDQSGLATGTSEHG
ncbi:virulence protein SciE type [Thiohalocapsa marina]|uniref:Virulence protein SciE type n=1 Tax=Thiohalocapsa marina TaxID=424902 RepID=A0A5M8FU74_9GAMM|nr:type VI secretion system accessory protein TagJ [Thiohalocapsa marina]KAA6187371.1 virulence protein SciE type [Thiohalocapsa marina]